MLNRLFQIVWKLIYFILSFGVILWSSLTIIFCTPESWSNYLLIVYLFVSISVLLFCRRIISFQINSLLFLALVFWFFSIEPMQNRDWVLENARVPEIEITGDLVTVRNIRNFNYRTETDFDVAYYDKTFDINKLKAADLFISFWDSKLIAHTILSFAFEDGEHLAVSIETRKEKGEQYSAVRGFFRQYELIYIASDERDVVRLRTNYRNEKVYLYRLSPPKEKLRAVFMDYVYKMEALSKAPQFYNAMMHNCTTSIYFSFQVAPPFPPLSLGIIFPGYLDHFIWTHISNMQLIDLPFEKFREQSFINLRAQAADQDVSFSKIIREGLPIYSKKE